MGFLGRGRSGKASGKGVVYICVSVSAKLVRKAKSEMNSKRTSAEKKVAAFAFIHLTLDSSRESLLPVAFGVNSG